jgi:hypothetical protein
VQFQLLIILTYCKNYRLWLICTLFNDVLSIDYWMSREEYPRRPTITVEATAGCSGVMLLLLLGLIPEKSVFKDFRKWTHSVDSKQLSNGCCLRCCTVTGTRRRHLQLGVMKRVVMRLPSLYKKCKLVVWRSFRHVFRDVQILLVMPLATYGCTPSLFL